GTVTRPKEMAPVQIERGMGYLVCPIGTGCPASCSARCALRAARGPRAGLLAHLVGALGELLDHLVVEGGEVVGLAAGHEALVDDDLLVDPLAAGVADVGLD